MARRASPESSQPTSSYPARNSLFSGPRCIAKYACDSYVSILQKSQQCLHSLPLKHRIRQANHRMKQRKRQPKLCNQNLGQKVPQRLRQIYNQKVPLQSTTPSTTVTLPTVMSCESTRRNVSIVMSVLISTQFHLHRVPQLQCAQLSY